MSLSIYECISMLFIIHAPVFAVEMKRSDNMCILYFTETGIVFCRWSWCMKGLTCILLKEPVGQIDHLAYILTMLSLSKLFLFWLVN